MSRGNGASPSSEIWKSDRSEYEKGMYVSVSVLYLSEYEFVSVPKYLLAEALLVRVAHVKHDRRESLVGRRIGQPVLL